MFKISSRILRNAHLLTSATIAIGLVAPSFLALSGCSNSKEVNALSFNCTPLTAAERGYVKFHPGHYVGISPGEPRLVNTLKEIKDLPGVTGVQRRYVWADLQSGPNDFNFAPIQRDLELLAPTGKKLSIMIMWKFSTEVGDLSPVPAFLKGLTSGSVDYALGGANTGDFNNGFVAAFDNAVVVEHFSRFLRQLSEAFDQHPNVSSIVFPETAIGTDFAGLGLTSQQISKIKDQFIDGVIAVDRNAACVFNHTPVIQLTNFPSNRLKDMTDAYKKATVGMGGPDVFLNDDTLERATTTEAMRAYDYYPLLEKQLPIGVIAAGGNYLYESHDPETLPAAERPPHLLTNLYGWNESQIIARIADKAVNQLKANYIFWRKTLDNDGQFYQAFLNHAAKLGTSSQTIQPTDTECPTNYAGTCRYD